MCECVYVRIVVNYCKGLSVFSTMCYDSQFALRDLPEQRLTDDVFSVRSGRLLPATESRPCVVAQPLTPWPSVFGSYH